MLGSFCSVVVFYARQMTCVVLLLLVGLLISTQCWELRSEDFLKRMFTTWMESEAALFPSGFYFVAVLL